MKYSIHNLRSMSSSLLICFFIILFTTIVYWNVRDFSFINYDDPLYVTENAYVKSGLSIETIKWSFTSATEKTNYWVPITWLSFLIDYEIYGDHPGGYHITNLFFHIINAILLFFLFNKMTGQVWPSGLVAILFALHPLHVESVAWVTERKDVLSAFFWLLAMWMYAIYAKKPNPYHYMAAFILFILGLMSKPIVVTAPFLFLLLDYWPLRRFQLKRFITKENEFPFTLPLIWEKLPFFLIIGFASIAAFVTQASGNAIMPLEDCSVYVRIENVLVAYIAYLGKMIWPIGLSPVYPHPGRLPLWQPVTAFALITGITCFVFYQSKRRPYLAVGWLWYIGTLVPVIGFVVIGPHAIADRYTYVPLIGIFVMIAWYIFDWVSLRAFRWFGIPIITVIVITLMITTQVQVQYWRDSITLFEHAIRVTKNNWLAHNNLGIALLEKGKVDEAEILIDKALSFSPFYVDALYNRGMIYQKKGQIEQAKAAYEKTLNQDPSNIKTHLNLGVLFTETGDDASAEKEYRAVLNIDPTHPEAHNNYGALFMDQGKWEKAVSHFYTALETDPLLTNAHYNLWSLYKKQGKEKKAMLHSAKIISILDNQDPATIHPNYAEVFFDVGVRLSKANEYKKAMRCFEKVIKIDSRNMSAQKNLEILSKLIAENK